MHLFHRWQTVKDTGIHQYQECRKCDKRRIVRDPQCLTYTPVDRQWLFTGEWANRSTPPWGSSGPKGPRNPALPQHPDEPDYNLMVPSEIDKRLAIMRVEGRIGSGKSVVDWD